MSANPSAGTLTSATSTPVLESGLEMKPFVPNARFVATKMKAAGFVKLPPSGFWTITGTAPLPFEGFGTGALKVIEVGVTLIGEMNVAVGPGLKTSCAPGWKLRPVTVYGPGADARFGVMLVRTGPGFTLSESWREVTCSGSSVTWAVKRKVPTVVGP